MLVVFCLASLAAGTRTAPIRDGIATAVSVTSYPFLKALGALEDGLNYSLDFVFAYSGARREVDSMRRVLVELMQRSAQRSELLEENRRLRRMMAFDRDRPNLVLEPVEVIDSFKGVVRVDRGLRHGLRESMCVVTEEGIVGPLTQVEPLSASVATLHNPECRIAAMVARNRVRGSIHGSGSDITRYCTMNYIDMKDEVQVGDLVVAAPESIFPTGYPIGRVRAVHADQGSLWKYADVEPIVDPYGLDEVFVMRRVLPPVEELAGEYDGGRADSVAPEVPDTRTIQERYAP